MRSIVAFLIVFAACTVAHGQTPRIDRIEIFEQGIYTADKEKLVQAPRTPTGTVANVTDVKLVSSTTTVPARVGTRFGFRYRIVGQPMGAKVILRTVTRFPSEGMRNPKTGEIHYRSEYTREQTIGATRYRDFGLDDAWEAVPGAWVFELWHGDKKLAEQRFTLVKP